MKALQPPKEPRESKRKAQNYYQEVYKPRKEQQRIEQIKQEVGLQDEQIKLILDKYNLVAK